MSPQPAMPPKASEPPSSRRGRWVARLIAGAAVGVGSVLAMAGPAAASFSTNTIGCAGSATIQGTGSDAGKTVTINATDSKATLLREGEANWQGSITTTTHNHSGKVYIDLGWFDVTAGSWGPSKNASNQNSKSGVTKLPSALKWVPPGDYRIAGHHTGDEGECAGSIDIRLNGSIVGNPVGIAAIIGTVLTAGGVGYAAFARGGRP